MNYKLLGQSGLRVSELSLGTMGFGTEWKWGADKEGSKKYLIPIPMRAAIFLIRPIAIQKGLQKNLWVNL